MEIGCPVEGCEGLVEIGWEPWDNGDGVWAQSGWAPYIVGNECGHEYTQDQEEEILQRAAQEGPSY
jgi:hypothetical protein